MRNSVKENLHKLREAVGAMRKENPSFVPAPQVMLDINMTIDYATAARTKRRDAKKASKEKAALKAAAAKAAAVPPPVVAASSKNKKVRLLHFANSFCPHSGCYLEPVGEVSRHRGRRLGRRQVRRRAECVRADTACYAPR